MDDPCHREIVDLHKFFEDWFNGKIAADDDTAGRLDAALGPKFEMVDPDGRIVPREEIVRIVRDARGRDAATGGVRIRIENVRCSIGGLAGHIESTFAGDQAVGIFGQQPQGGQHDRVF